MAAVALGLVCLLLCLPALARAPSRRHVATAALFVTILTASTDLPKTFAWFPRLPGTYNWTGKLLELATGLMAAALLVRSGRWTRDDLGLTASFRPGTGRDVLRVLVPFIVVETALLWFLVPGEMPRFEDHAFQLTAPGLSEELAFRGVLLALLDRAFLRRVRICGAGLGWGAVVTSVLFGLWHGLDVDGHGQLSVDVAPMAIPMVGGFVLAWCRARSGSLLLPLFAHSGMNEVANLIAAVKVDAGVAWSRTGPRNCQRC